MKRVICKVGPFVVVDRKWHEEVMELMHDTYDSIRRERRILGEMKKEMQMVQMICGHHHHDPDQPA